MLADTCLLHYCFATVDLDSDIRIKSRYVVVSTSVDANNGGGEILQVCSLVCSFTKI